MPVQQSSHISDSSADSKPKPVSKKAQAGTSGGDAVGTRTGKEQDAIYREEGKLLSEVKEKYKEADLEAQKQIEKAIGVEAKDRAEEKIPSDVKEAGVESREETASSTLAQQATVELPISQTEYKSGLKLPLGGKRLINKNIIKVPSLVGLVIYVGRLIKRAHMNAKSVIFKQKDETAVKE